MFGSCGLKRRGGTLLRLVFIIDSASLVSSGVFFVGGGASCPEAGAIAAPRRSTDMNRKRKMGMARS